MLFGYRDVPCASGPSAVNYQPLGLGGSGVSGELI